MKKTTPKSAGPRKAPFGSRRAEVVDLLQRGLQTVAELAVRLRLSDNAVRSHLLALERDGLVSRVGSRPGARRPHELYQLTPRAQKYLAQASTATLSAVLAAMKEVLPAQDLSAVLETGGRTLASRFGTGYSEKPLAIRVQNAARILNSIGGVAEIQEEKDRFRILSQGCPLGEVTAEHPETCCMIEKFLTGLVNAPVRESCLRGPHPRCQFVIDAKPERSASRRLKH